MSSNEQHQRYEPVSTLGRGGFAEVFLGWMHSVGGLRRKVAIKRILPELVEKQSQMFEEMFVDEARLAFQLEHENIVRVYDVGKSSNTYFIVMEYVEGMDLKKIYELLTERGELMPLSECLFIGTQACAGLGYAHALRDDEDEHLGLVHNDISPPNILIGRLGEVKVADFGLSDARSNTVQTPDGMVKGKFAYISPEGTRDPTLVSHRSDIFSLGIVLWEIISGRRLFQRSTDIETFKAVRNADVTDLRSVRPDVPPLLAKAIHKALAKDPADRYENCEEFYLDLLEVSHTYNIPFHRYGLQKLVSKLSAKVEGEFLGERLSEEDRQNFLGELGSILPPGVADHLKTFVANAIVTEVEPAIDGAIDDSWMGDVFDEVDFDDGSVSFIAEPPEISSENLQAVEEVPEPPPEPAPPEPAPPKPTPPKPAPPKPTPPVSAQTQVETIQKQLEEDFKSQKLMTMIMGSLGGIVLGAIMGFIIGVML